MPPSVADTGPALRLAGVHADYGGRPVLGGLGFAVAAGEAYALLGPNGAGKSTAARVACGLKAVTAGTVEVLGRKPGVVGRGRIGLAPQDCALFGALTIRENLLAMARAGGLAKVGQSGAVEEALASTLCGERADNLVQDLSGGWRRRANLAAALVCRPSLLVLDEPTEGVDAGTRQVLVEAVRACLRGGAACLLISHDAAFARAVADRIGLLSGGRLVEEGAAHDLIRGRFGDAGRLTIRFPIPPATPLASALRACGLTCSPDGVTWMRIDTDVDAVGAALLEAVKSADGEVSIRRPDLDDLVAHLHAGQP